jgi:RNA polymerase sigma factor (sigma-70 family)
VDTHRPYHVAAPWLALARAGRLGDLSDAELLERSATADTNPEVAEAAFSAIVRRHGSMVMGVCRTILRDHHESEDAFQATFLLLVRDARRLRVSDTVGPWLHEVAVRVCLAARRASIRRDRLQAQAATRAAVGRGGQPGPHVEAERNEVAELVHAEIARLSPHLRSCVVMCDLEGMTYAQAARTLGVPIGTVQSRLARARTRLRKRLAGQSQSRPWNAAENGETSLTVLPPLLASRTATLCAVLSADSTTALLSLCPGVTLLMKGGSRMRFVPILSRVAAIVTLTVLVGSLAVYSQSTVQENRVRDRRDTPHGFLALSGREQPRGDSVLAPRELEAAGGSGKILIYEMDREGKRRPGEPRGQGEVEQKSSRETEVAVSWAVVTGVIPNRAILKDAGADVDGLERRLRFYRRVELSRQELANEGFWSERQLVDVEPTIRILDNLPEVDEELLPPEFRLGNLVAPLPHRTDGRWSRVNPEPILISSRLTEPRVIKLNPNSKEEVLAALGSETLMMRSFDFSVVPGRTYRYRARLILATQLANRPGQRAGEWSRPTEPVAIPRVATARRDGSMSTNPGG